jgi:hypothetical protein
MIKGGLDKHLSASEIFKKNNVPIISDDFMEI